MRKFNLKRFAQLSIMCNFGIPFLLALNEHLRLHVPFFEELIKGIGVCTFLCFVFIYIPALTFIMRKPVDAGLPFVGKPVVDKGDYVVVPTRSEFANELFLGKDGFSFNKQRAFRFTLREGSEFVNSINSFLDQPIVGLIKLK